MNAHFEKHFSGWLSNLGHEQQKMVLLEAKKSGQSVADLLRKWILEYSDQIIAESSATKIPTKTNP